MRLLNYLHRPLYLILCLGKEENSAESWLGRAGWGGPGGKDFRCQNPSLQLLSAQNSAKGQLFSWLCETLLLGPQNVRSVFKARGKAPRIKGCVCVLRAVGSTLLPSDLQTAPFIQHRMRPVHLFLPFFFHACVNISGNKPSRGSLLNQCTFDVDSYNVTLLLCFKNGGGGG